MSILSKANNQSVCFASQLCTSSAQINLISSQIVCRHWSHSSPLYISTTTTWFEGPLYIQAPVWQVLLAHILHHHFSPALYSFRTHHHLADVLISCWFFPDYVEQTQWQHWLVIVNEIIEGSQLSIACTHGESDVCIQHYSLVISSKYNLKQLQAHITSPGT